MKNDFFTFLILLVAVIQGLAQSNNDILNVLVANQTISQSEADSIRAEAAISQQNFLPDKKFKIDLELRPRFQYRNGYQQIPNDTTKASFLVDQRSRLTLNYLNENNLEIRLSVQDVRIWGQQDPRLTSPANIQIFEAWAEPYIARNFSVRLGRQILSFDNQRIFSLNNWRTGGQSHDAVTFRYNTSLLSTDLAAAFNQLSDRTFGTDFKPVGFTNYKFLAVNYLRYKISNRVTLTVINAADGYQNTRDAENLNMRFTDGGRIEFEKGKYYLTFSGYNQSGKNPSGTKLRAWYLQPEARYTSPFNLKIRLGVEVFSGDWPGTPGVDDHSFVPLYGTNHQFNGFLDLITKFPDHTGRAGLINPYLSFTQIIGKKLEIRTDFLTFHSKEQIVQNDIRLEKYLGFENDWLAGYKPNNFTKADIGMSWAFITESLAAIRKSGAGAADHHPAFVYLILTFTPQLFSTSFK